MMNSALIRPAWTPVTLAMMVVGFMIAWPLGLAMIAYIMFGERLDMFKRDVNNAADGFARSCRGFGRKGPVFRTGNVAFDDWRDAELARLDEERRKLDELRDEFDDYVRELRRAKDQEEFDLFMAERRKEAKETSPKKRSKSVPDFKDLGSAEA